MKRGPRWRCPDCGERNAYGIETCGACGRLWSLYAQTLTFWLRRIERDRWGPRQWRGCRCCAWRARAARLANLRACARVLVARASSSDDRTAALYAGLFEERRLQFAGFRAWHARDLGARVRRAGAVLRAGRVVTGASWTRPATMVLSRHGTVDATTAAADMIAQQIPDE